MGDQREELHEINKDALPVDENWKKTKLSGSFFPNIPDDVEMKNVSDGYHTFGELYEFRMVFNALLFNEWNENYKYRVHKSYKHFDGEDCFGGGWFIVVALLPGGQITNHYENKYWDLFKIPTSDKALFEFDGHTADDVLKRMSELLQ